MNKLDLQDWKHGTLDRGIDFAYPVAYNRPLPAVATWVDETQELPESEPEIEVVEIYDRCEAL